MSQFYVYSSIPPLEFFSKPDIASENLMELFNLNFTKNEMKKAHTLKLWIDIQNIYSFLFDKEFDDRGNYSKNTLKSLLVNREILPDYVFEFFSIYESEEEQKKYFPWLLSKYFKIEVEKNNGFMREFLEFEYHLRIVTTGYRSKNLKRDIGKELQFENVGDPIVAMTLAQKDTSSAYVFPYEFHDLEAAIADAGPNPTQKYDVIAEYRFNFYTKYIIDFPFTLKASLAYMMSLWILEEYFALKQDKGEVVLDQIVEKENVS